MRIDKNLIFCPKFLSDDYCLLYFKNLKCTDYAKKDDDSKIIMKKFRTRL